MSDLVRISQLSALSSVDLASNYFVVLDENDTTQSAEGSTKKVAGSTISDAIWALSSLYITASDSSTTTTVNVNSANWQNTFTNFSTQSANNISVRTTVNSNSANWQSVYSTVNANSATTWVGGGGMSYLPLSGGTMDAGAEIAFASDSRIRQNPSGYGLDTVCANDYIHRWENGTLYITDPLPYQTIRVAQYKLTTPPNEYQDETLGYRIGSRFILDDGTTYVCTSATAENATWHLVGSALPLTYAATLTPDCDEGLFRSVVMTGDLEINAPTNGVDGMRMRLRLIASGAARELTFHAAIVKPTGSTYEATVANSSYRVVELEYNGSFWMMTKNLEFPD